MATEMSDAFSVMDRCQGPQCAHAKCITQKRLEDEVARLREQLEAERESVRLCADEGQRPW